VEDLERAYIQANEARRRQQANLKSDIDAAMAAGMSRREIYRAFDNTGVSRKELGLIMRNKYEPIQISRDLIREVRGEVNIKDENRVLKRVPTQQINAIRRDLRNTPIVGEPEPAQETFVPIPVTSAPAPQPRSVPEPRPSETFVGRTMDTITGTGRDLAQGLRQRAQAIAPSLLGGDPASQAANAEIARRSQGQ
jgi:AraC-like DNA-binding protein